MRSSHYTSLVKGAVALGMTSLTLLAFFAFQELVLEGGLSSLAESVRNLEREGKKAQRLAEWERRIHESEQRINLLVNDLINQRSDLREAAARWREACFEVESRVIEILYPQGATEEERIIFHLFYMVGRQLEKQPSVCAKVLARLRQEKAFLEAEDHRGERCMIVETLLPPSEDHE